MTRKFVAFFVLLGTIGTIVLTISSCACAADYFNAGRSGDSGSDAYVIDSITNLQLLRDRVNAGTESADKYYRLSENLNLSAITNWEPIGTDSHPFQGHFNGDNLSIHIITDRGNRDIAGVFGRVSTTNSYAIENLTVSGTINGRWTGGICVTLSSGSIENCHFTGTSESEGYEGSTTAGGIATEITNGTIKNCSVRGTINSTATGTSWLQQSCYAGGIVAHMTGGNIENCTVSGSSVGAKGATYVCAGGIVGNANIANFNSIKACNFSGTVNSVHYAGGIVGYMSGGSMQDNHIGIDSSIICNSWAGGIAGRIGDATVLDSCDIAVGATVSADNEAAGGIVGLLNKSRRILATSVVSKVALFFIKNRPHFIHML